MDWQRAEGIVLRRYPVTETSLVVTWFTRDRGKLKTMAKGARRVKTPFLGKLDLFYQDELVYLPSRRSDLHLLHDCFLVNARPALRESYALLSQASCGCELVDLACETEDPQPVMFDRLAGWLDDLPHAHDPRAVLFWFVLQVLATAGWRPRWTAPSGIRRVLAALIEASPATVRRVKLTADQAQAAGELVWHFWEEQIGRTPRSRQALPF